MVGFCLLRIHSYVALNHTGPWSQIADAQQQERKKMSNTAVKSPIPTLANSPFKKDVLKGRVVVITGGATGIGYACSLAFGFARVQGSYNVETKESYNGGCRKASFARH